MCVISNWVSQAWTARIWSYRICLPQHFLPKMQGKCFTCGNIGMRYSTRARASVRGESTGSTRSTPVKMVERQPGTNSETIRVVPFLMEDDSCKGRFFTLSEYGHLFVALRQNKCFRKEIFLSKQILNRYQIDTRVSPDQFWVDVVEQLFINPE